MLLKSVRMPEGPANPVSPYVVEQEAYVCEGKGSGLEQGEREEVDPDGPEGFTQAALVNLQRRDLLRPQPFHPQMAGPGFLLHTLCVTTECLLKCPECLVGAAVEAQARTCQLGHRVGQAGHG